MNTRKLACLLALGFAACAHQPRVHIQPAVDIRDLCHDADTRSFCTPAPAEVPLVDTNLVAPPAPTGSFAG
jgi:hypothetical protein